LKKNYVSSVELASLIEQAKVGLNISLHSEFESEGGIDARCISCTRIPQFLSQDVCVISEVIPLDNYYDKYMVSMEADALAEYCGRLLTTGDWQYKGREAGALFRKEMDSRTICKPVIDKTLSRLKKPLSPFNVGMSGRPAR